MADSRAAPRQNKRKKLPWKMALMRYKTIKTARSAAYQPGNKPGEKSRIHFFVH